MNINKVVKSITGGWIRLKIKSALYLKVFFIILDFFCLTGGDKIVERTHEFIGHCSTRSI